MKKHYFLKSSYNNAYVRNVKNEGTKFFFKLIYLIQVTKMSLEVEVIG